MSQESPLPTSWLSGHTFSCGTHTGTRIHGHVHTGLGTCLPHLHRSALLGDASVLLSVVISVSAALRSLPWGLRPLLPIFVCCPISAPGPGSCAVNAPLWPPG